ncbi:MAG: helix-turn-helix transcriptional regulator [Oscillospiraceae bacterium]|nr:helix-turn-helix transcriptional regulator [Oscillospiraceae bacterium]
MSISEELIVKEYIMREENEYRAPYSSEFEFYLLVKNGEVEKIKEFSKKEFSEKTGFGKLCENPLQNIKYHFVVTAALIARYCIDGGMAHETAYNLSDLYINRADKARSFKEISELHAEMSLDYTKRMRRISKSRIFSKPIIIAVDYIYENISKRITLTDLAEVTELNESYLSRLFKKETGETVTDYILRKKIETAENMLKYSSYPPSEIAFMLGFPSQSYFTAVFKKLTGTTPKKYRDCNFRKIDIE